ncbi:MAG: glycosyltransferase, partial [Bacilli bacterium]
MVITFVVDMIGATNNGTTVTAMRTAEILKKHGHVVRFIAFVPKDHSDLTNFDIFGVDTKLNFGIFNPLIDDNGMYLAKLSNDDFPRIRKFLEGSDIVHLMMPFKLEMQVRLVAKAMGIPVSSAMHVQPENVSYNIKMGHSHLINSIIYALFNTWMYHYIQNIHTPSMMMKDQMIKHHYRNDIFPISNGVSSKFVPTPTQKPDNLKDKFVILMIGRLSGEKRQDLIIKAIGKSKFNGDIQLILCGQGPKKKAYTKLSEKYLKNPVIYKFVPQEELLKIINYCDLYIHASDAESEAISCIEAFSCGKVP